MTYQRSILSPIIAGAEVVCLTDARKTPTPGRDPDDGYGRVWPGKGQHRSKPHSDRTGKADQAWSRNKVKAVYPASYRPTGTIIPVNILGQVACDECGEIPVYAEDGRLVCKCTVWNEGTPRPDRTINPMPDVIRARQWRKLAKGGRC